MPFAIMCDAHEALSAGIRRQERFLEDADTTRFGTGWRTRFALRRRRVPDDQLGRGQVLERAAEAARCRPAQTGNLQTAMGL